MTDGSARTTGSSARCGAVRRIRPSCGPGALTHSKKCDRSASDYVAHLASLGIRRGDRVAVFAETCPELIAAFVGHLMSGVVHVPINTRYKADEARHILEDSGAVAVLAGEEGEECAEVLREILRRCPAHLRHVLALREAFPAGPNVAAAPPLPSSPSKQIFSSSSPPLPVRRRRRHAHLHVGHDGQEQGRRAVVPRARGRTRASVTGLWRFAPEDRLVLALPLFHVHGLGLGVAGMLVNGLTLLLEPRFDAARVVRGLRGARARPSSWAFPTMYVRLLEHLEAHPEAAAALRKARLFTAGSAPLPAADFETFRARTGHAILERYGMSETLFTLSNPYDGRAAARHRRPPDARAARCGSSTTRGATSPTASSARSS